MKLYILLATVFFTITAFCQTAEGDEFASIKQEADALKSRGVDATYDNIPKKAGYFIKAAALYKKSRGL